MEKLRSREKRYTTKGKDLELEPRSPEEYRKYFEDKSVQSAGLPACLAVWLIPGFSFISSSKLHAVRGKHVVLNYQILVK